jgi:hypothetical protein
MASSGLSLLGAYRSPSPEPVTEAIAEAIIEVAVEPAVELAQEHEGSVTLNDSAPEILSRVPAA